MARSILRAGKIAGVVIVAIIVVAVVLYSAGVLSVAQTDYPPPETTTSPESLPAEPTEVLLTQCENEYALASKNRKSGKLNEAKSLYQDISENPDRDWAILGHAGVAMCEYRLGNEEAGDELIELIKKDYSTNEYLDDAICSVASVCSNSKNYGKAIDLFQYVVQNSSDSNLLFKAKSRLATCQIRLGNDSAADQVIEALVDEYSQHPDLCAKISELAKTCCKVRNFAKAKVLYEYVALGSSDSDLALAAREGIVRSLIGLGNADGTDADAEVAGLLGDYEGDERVAGVALRLGNEYCKKKLYESALGLYEYVAGNYAESKEAITAQRKVVTTNIDLEDEEAAQQALDELTLRFADDPRLSRELYEVGECYRKRKDYPLARAFYDYVATEFPQTNDAMWSTQCQILIDIDEIEDPNYPAPNIPPPILTKVDNLIADFEGQPGLTQAVFFLGEEYYRNAHKGNFGPIKKDAKRYWPRAVKLWEKVYYRKIRLDYDDATAFSTIFISFSG